MFIVGYVMKDGNLVGLKVFEYCIDSFMMLEGESDGCYCMFWSYKNCFGVVNEFGVFVMIEKGFKEVSNLLVIFLSWGDNEMLGFSVMVIWEGICLLFVEI